MIFPIKEENAIFNNIDNILYSNIDIYIKPQEIKEISLPYYSDLNDFAILNLNKSLILNGLTLLWSNINEKSSEKRIDILVKNDNNPNINISPIEYIIGDNNSILIKRKTAICNILLIKVRP